jgi:choice-of-anchor C domain-containing protein
MKRYVVSALVLLVAVGAASADTTNLLTNGGFETTVSGIPVSGWLPLAPGSNEISPWLVGGASPDAVDVVGSLWAASEGTKSLDLNGTNVGWVQQSFSAVAGEWYTLTFSMSGNPGGHNEWTSLDKEMRVFVTTANGGGAYQDFVFTPDNTFEDMKWVARSWTFQAPGNTTILKFESLSGNSNGCGPCIDNVCVSQTVPVPGALLLAGLGTAIVGWVRGRKLS